mgnify:CR=1 FL=1
MKRILSILILLSLISCQPGGREDTEKLKVVCTTGMIGDALRHLMGEKAEVKVLMGPGVDPHLYKATQGDIRALTDADLIVYNGLHLEGKMTGILEKMAREKEVVALAELLPRDQLINTTDYADAHDPHIWFDVTLWSKAIGLLSNRLATAYPEMKNSINLNTTSYRDSLRVLHLEVVERINQIPPTQRVLITAHDAFKYFGDRYGIEVRGLQGISTTSEYGIRDVSNLVSYVTDNNIPAIFVESSVPKRAIEAVIEGARERGHDLRLGGELYSDAMGAAGTAEGTYMGMVRHNVAVIVSALK